MKTNHNIHAFIIAVSIHLIPVVLFWLSTNTSQENSLIEKPEEVRFGISLNEEILIDRLDVQPSIKTKSPAGIQQNNRQKPPESKQTAIEKPAYTEADSDNLPFSVIHHYGESFFSLPAGEQHYIIDNLQRIRKINEIVGTALLEERSDDIDPSDHNIVTFMLHPDGTISNLELERHRIDSPLDELTLQTVNLAHTRYPKPNQPTHIRIKVYIVVK